LGQGICSQLHRQQLTYFIVLLSSINWPSAHTDDKKLNVLRVVVARRCVPTGNGKRDASRAVAALRCAFMGNERRDAPRGAPPENRQSNCLPAPPSAFNQNDPLGNQVNYFLSGTCSQPPSCPHKVQPKDCEKISRFIHPVPISIPTPATRRLRRSTCQRCRDCQHT